MRAFADGLVVCCKGRGFELRWKAEWLISPDIMAWFQTTAWSVVLAAGQGQEEQQRAALEELCRNYRGPVLHYIQTNIPESQEAQDLTQRFFERVLQKKWLERANPTRGRFRSFLLTILKRFLISERIHSQRLKRGGGLAHDSLDERQDPVDASLPPDEEFDRRWALAIVQRATEKLRMEAVAAGQDRLFDVLSQWLIGAMEPGSYASAGAEFGLSRQGVALAIHRLRQRLRQLIHDEVAETLCDSADVDGEVKELIAALRPPQGNR